MSVFRGSPAGTTSGFADEEFAMKDSIDTNIADLTEIDGVHRSAPFASAESEPST